MSPHIKLALLLVPLLTGAPAAALIFLENGKPAQAAPILAIHCALCVGLLPFIAKAALHISVFRELRQVVDFSTRLRRGAFPPHFELPVEKEDEHIIIRLKRGLNWMLHKLKDREVRLLSRLEETDQARRDLEDLSRRDPLTGLGNRRHFDEFMRQSGAEDEPCPEVLLLLLDCDKFKRVNDTYGHQAGDEVLMLLAGIIRDSIRSGADAAFRLGGDEFAVSLSCSEDQALEVARRISERFKSLNGRGCTLSMGLAARCPAASGAQTDLDNLVARADAALYAAKGAGGDKLRRR